MNQAYAVIIIALLAISALPEGSTECSIERVGEGQTPSWIVKDSKGCGFNRGVDPTYVMDCWLGCEVAGGYDYDDNECVVWGIGTDEEGEK